MLVGPLGHKGAIAVQANHNHSHLLENIYEIDNYLEPEQRGVVAALVKLATFAKWSNAKVRTRLLAGGALSNANLNLAHKHASAIRKVVKNATCRYNAQDQVANRLRELGLTPVQARAIAFAVRLLLK